MLKTLVLIIIFTTLYSCSHGVAGNEKGSNPLNSKEEVEYKKAIVRCVKTGGSRVIKILGRLECH